MAQPPLPTEPITLSNWETRRSGTSMTVTGTNIDTGEAAKLTNIETITPPDNPADHHVIAKDVNGLKHRLTFAA